MIPTPEGRGCDYITNQGKIIINRYEAPEIPLFTKHLLIRFGISRDRQACPLRVSYCKSHQICFYNGLFLTEVEHSGTMRKSALVPLE